MINRRDVMKASAALFGAARLPLALGVWPIETATAEPEEVNPPPKPKNLFSSTFTPELLSRSLISASEWHPYPKVVEREAWQQVYPEVAATAIAR